MSLKKITSRKKIINLIFGNLRICRGYSLQKLKPSRSKKDLKGWVQPLRFSKPRRFKISSRGLPKPRRFHYIFLEELNPSRSKKKTSKDNRKPSRSKKDLKG